MVNLSDNKNRAFAIMARFVARKDANLSTPHLIQEIQRRSHLRLHRHQPFWFSVSTGFSEAAFTLCPTIDAMTITSVAATETSSTPHGKSMR